jgi:hypothetical protein
MVAPDGMKVMYKQKYRQGAAPRMKLALLILK